MKLYIGTLFCGENELAACSAMIESQSYRNFEHFVFSHLSNKNAHDTLFRDFLRRPEFDILIKVDADTVLRDADFFQRVADMFTQHPAIDLIEFVVYDHIERVVNMGLNCYRQGFRIVDKGQLFVDRITDIPDERRMICRHVSSTHCPDPSAYQAFHFGYHAQLKNKYDTVRNTLRSYLETFDRKRALALCGAIDVRKGILGLTHNQSYSDTAIQARVEHYSRMSSPGLCALILSSYLSSEIRLSAERAKHLCRRAFWKSPKTDRGSEASHASCRRAR